MIATERLILRKPAKEDFERFFEINHDPETNIHNPSGPMSFEKAEGTFTRMLEHWEKYHFGSWAIAEKQNPEKYNRFWWAELQTLRRRRKIEFRLSYCFPGMGERICHRIHKESYKCRD